MAGGRALATLLVVLLMIFPSLVPNTKAGHAWTLETVDSTGNTGEYTSLALDASGNPHISYRDTTNYDLRYAVKSGGVWTLETVDTTGNTGWYTSLALEADGDPQISYFDCGEYVDGGCTKADLRYASTNPDVTPPPTPSLLTPANGSATDDDTPTLNWSDVSDPTGITYQLQADNNPDFLSPAINISGISASQFTLAAPIAEDTYHWRVRAVDGAGNAGSYSSTFSFTITPDTTPPPTPTPTAPVNGTMLADNTPSFDWSDVTDPSGVSYQIQVDDDPDFSSPEIEARDLPASAYTTTTTLDDGVYYWRVRAVDGAGNIGSLSSIFTLTIETTPTPITPLVILLAILTATALKTLRRRRDD